MQPTGVIINQILVPPWGQFKPIFCNFSWTRSVLQFTLSIKILIEIYPVIKLAILTQILCLRFTICVSAKTISVYKNG